MVVNIQAHPSITKVVGIQADVLLAASSPKQPSTPIAATMFSFTDDDETYDVLYQVNV